MEEVKYGWHDTLRHVWEILRGGKFLRPPQGYGWFKLGIVLMLIMSTPLILIVAIVSFGSGKFYPLILCPAFVLLFGLFILPYTWHNVKITSRRLDAGMRKMFREDIRFHNEYYVIRKNDMDFYVGYMNTISRKGKWMRAPQETIMMFYRCEFESPTRYLDLMEEIEAYLGEKMQGQQYIRSGMYMLYVGFDIQWTVYSHVTREELDAHIAETNLIFDELAYIADRFNLTPIGVEQYKKNINNALRYFEGQKKS